MNLKSKLKQLILPRIRKTWVLANLPEVRAEMESQGFIFLRKNFYAPVPTIEEIQNSWEKKYDQRAYLEPSIYDNNFLVHFLKVNLLPYSKAFMPPLEADEKEHIFFWKNPNFSYSDAMAYYCMIRHLKPSSIIEIGAGYSSLIARQALKDNGQGRLTLIEPYPAEFLLNLPDLTLIQKPIQDVPASFFVDGLGKNDILFIDTTHTVKSGGDCIYIYLKLLPQVKKDVAIHIHDIFLPDMMPEKWMTDLGLYWTEQYLLQAYLLDNPKIQVLYGSNYHYLENQKTLEELMEGKYPAGGSSFWLRKTG
jgi:hypothetical protein